MSDSDIIGHSIIDYEAVAPIYCWRYYAFGTCEEHNCLALRGQLYTFTHASLTPEAICRKPEVNNGKPYCSEMPAFMPAKHEEHAPIFECVCGYYALYEPNPVQFWGEIAVWGQAIGQTVLADYGIRTRQFRLLAGFLPKPQHSAPSWGMMPEYQIVIDHFKKLQIPIARIDQAEDLIGALGIPTTMNKIYKLKREDDES